MKTLGKISNFATSTFALWVIVFAVFSFLVPEGFAWIAPHISLLLGIIMFGMGLTLSLDDFKGIVKAPKSVFIGVAAQYTIMPLLAFGLAYIFQLPPEIAVGVILVGCCPGGYRFQRDDLYGQRKYGFICYDYFRFNIAGTDFNASTDIAFG